LSAALPFSFSLSAGSTDVATSLREADFCAGSGADWQREHQRVYEERLQLTIGLKTMCAVGSLKSRSARETHVTRRRERRGGSARSKARAAAARRISACSLVISASRESSGGVPFLVANAGGDGPRAFRPTASTGGGVKFSAPQCGEEVALRDDVAP